MTTPFWCLLVITLMPYLIAPIGGYFRAKQFGLVDNKNPRIQAAGLVGIGSRAQAAQANAWEALPVFASAVLVAHLAGADPGASSTAALVFIAARLGHAGFWSAYLRYMLVGLIVAALTVGVLALLVEFGGLGGARSQLCFAVGEICELAL